MTELVIRNISKSFGASPALHPTDLVVHKGEFMTILGPSGCGKSTLLRILMGITAHSTGEIELAGQRIENQSPEQRDIAMVFQSYALFPHMSVSKNLDFGLSMKKVPASDKRQRIAHAVDICNLADLMSRMPRQLSGGQQQRVALARAIVMQPRVLLLDEPLSNLDAKLRENLRDELVQLHRRAGTTTLYVTHDQSEAMAMSDRIVVMNGGRVVEIGTPHDLYHRPSFAFTAGFLGRTNLIDIEILGHEGRLPWGAPVMVDTPRQGRATVSLRPESIALSPAPSGAGKVLSLTFMGSQAEYVIRVGDLTVLASRNSAEPVLAIGSQVELAAMNSVPIIERAAGSLETA
jgi:putative spermidine/putrescine transport system ATP-binding protein